jgi:hypothetical protein
MGKPAPFQRPSIDLGSVKKDWKTVNIYSVSEGDMVQDRGLVVGITEVPGGLRLAYKSGVETFYDEGDTVYAFVKL